MTPEVRRARALAGALLHEDFVEFGSSGAVWRRETTLRALAEEPGERAHEPLDLECAVLGSGCVLLTYSTRSGDRTTLRSSIWVQDGDGDWRLRFHQGTITAASG
jgi:ribonuclease HI